MLQSFIAIVIILFFLSRTFWQKQKGELTKNEFIFWLAFWVLALLLILNLKFLDRLFATWGFSSSAIQVLLYLAVTLLFYFIFRLRLRLQQIEKNITKIVEHLAINKKK